MTPVIDILNAERSDQPLYILGNCLRGYVHGRFPDDKTAFAEMGARFDRSYPSKGGRKVEFWRCIERSGFDHTAGGNLAKEPA